jgi:hypothetical protein
MDAATVVNSYELSRVLNAMRVELALRPKNLWRVVLRAAATENLVAMIHNQRLGVWSDPQFVTKYNALRDHLTEANTTTLRTATENLAALLERVENRERS